VQEQLDLTHAIFGPDLDSAIATESEARLKSRCQQKVFRKVTKCQDTKLKEFNKCKKLALRQGADDETDLEACMFDDPKAKTTKACIDKMCAQVQRRCVLKQVDLSDAFGGCDTDDQGELVACLGRYVGCLACAALNEADGLNRSCDEVTDDPYDTCSIAIPGLAEVGIPKQSDWTDDGVVVSSGPSGSWDARFGGQIGPSTVVKKDGTYFLYYIGADGDRSTDGGPRHRALGVATSTDGIRFTKYAGNPVIEFLPHRGNSWDEEEGVFTAGARVDESGRVVMYYGAMTAISPTLVDDDARIAISDDGFDFTDQGIVIDHADASVWGYGDELDPLGVFTANGNWYVYYSVGGGWDFSGNKVRWGLGLAWGPRRDHLPHTKGLINSSTYVMGGCDPVRLSAEKVALFIVRESGSTRYVEVRTDSVSCPGYLSAPAETYNFGDLKHQAVFLDRESNTWFMYYRSSDNAIRVKTAPVAWLA
jgi:hypothetical protein